MDPCMCVVFHRPAPSIHIGVSTNLLNLTDLGMVLIICKQ